MDNKWHTGCCVVFRVEKWVDKQVYLKPVSKLRLFYHVTCSNLRGQWKRASISASSVRRMSSGNSSQHDICTTASISEHTFMFLCIFCVFQQHRHCSVCLRCVHSPQKKMTVTMSMCVRNANETGDWTVLERLMLSTELLWSSSVKKTNERPTRVLRVCSTFIVRACD